MSASIMYLDINLSTGSEGVVQLQKNVIRSTPVVNIPEDYYVAVARLVVPTALSVWLWQPTLVADGSPQADGYNTIYNITMRVKTSGITAFTTTPVPLIVVIEDPFVAPPAVPLTSQPITGWGAVYDFSTIVQMLNVALAKCYDQIKTYNPSVFNGMSPYYTFDPVTQLFTVNCCPMNHYDQLNALNGIVIEIYFNNAYQPYLMGFPCRHLNTTTNDELDNLLLIRNKGNNWIQNQTITNPATWLPPPNTPSNPFVPSNAYDAMIRFTQDYTATWVFNALASIQVISSLPTYSEFTDLPIYLQGSSPNNATTQILTDFACDYTAGGAGSFAQPITYTPACVIPGARYISLAGKSPIQDFIIGLSWLDTLGVSRPMSIVGSAQNASLKLVFIKKSIIDNNLGDWRNFDTK